MNRSNKKLHIETEKKNKVIIERIDPDEINKIWSRLHELNKSF